MRHQGQPQGGYWYSNAIRESDLPLSTRAVALVIASVADSSTGRARVSLTTLEKWTGGSRSTVARALKQLEAEGWLMRDRPEAWRAQREHAPTAYTTVIPPGYPIKASPTVGLGLVPYRAKASVTVGPSSIRTKGAGVRTADAAPTAPKGNPCPHGINNGIRLGQCTEPECVDAYDRLTGNVS